jgi:hypothetical protein
MKYSNPTTVVLEDYGTGDGITEIRNRLRDNEMQYALLRIPLSDQGQHVAAGSEIQVHIRSPDCDIYSTTMAPPNLPVVQAVF